MNNNPTQAQTITLEGGKYAFDLQDGVVIGARRHGEPWQAGMDLRSTNVFVAALNRILELEQEARQGDATQEVERIA